MKWQNVAAVKQQEASAEPEISKESPTKKRRPRLLQEDVPGYSLEQAIRVPKAIAENYAYRPTRPLNVAGAMGMSPTSGPFRTITGAAVAYGLTSGGQSAEIGITPLGMRIVRPTTEGDDIAGKREALLRPKVIGDFLRSYDGAALPSETIAKNVLQEKVVPTERLDDVLGLIIESANAVGFIREWNGKRYIDISGQPSSTDVVDTGVTQHAARQETAVPQTLPIASTLPTTVSASPGIHIHIEIHIAADASSDTVEDMFRNMRRYVLATDGQSDDDATDSE
jgi:hypothetical protein